MSSKKIYGLCGLKHHIVEIRDHASRAGQQTTNEQTMEDRATQLMEARRLSFAICSVMLMAFLSLVNPVPHFAFLVFERYLVHAKLIHDLGKRIL